MDNSNIEIENEDKNIKYIFKSLKYDDVSDLYQITNLSKRGCNKSIC